ncbi:uncharacterized protein LOC130796751 isoform X2 [Amaranthus tricolor]|nr:uncharacterized protein LOC130796751 isoform X2 [Amaranthus tricolor]
MFSNIPSHINKIQTFQNTQNPSFSTPFLNSPIITSYNTIIQIQYNPLQFSFSMEEEAAINEAAFKPAHLVTFSPIPIFSSSLNHRRLSSQFSKPNSPIKAGIRKKIASSSASTVAWISLQGRLIGAEEATSSQAIGGGLSRKEAVAWELFSPIHRVLIVAVVAVATAKCEKNRQIARLRNCVQLRDEILASMQQKLDDLCVQMNCNKDHPQEKANLPASKILDHSSTRSSLPGKSDSVCSDCWFCDQRRAESIDFSGNSLVKASSGDEMFRSRLSISNQAEQEERRLSDLSDWASSVTSATDLQLNNLAIEQDTYNLKKECEEKDTAIKELSAFIRSKDVATSKRIVELEEVICRKNTMITKLKKDLIVLEQKVVNLTRTRRRSFPGTNLEKKQQLPTMSDNLLYDMDSPLSSDSDSSSKKQNTSDVQSEVVVEAVANTPVQKSFSDENVPKKNPKLRPAKLSLQVLKSRQVSPLKEKSLNQRQYSSTPSMQNQVLASASLKHISNRRRTQSSTKDVGSHKRWM